MCYAESGRSKPDAGSSSKNGMTGSAARFVQSIVDSMSCALNRWIEYMLTYHRSIFACLVLLPMSLVYDAVSYVRSSIVFKMKSAPAHHAARVAHVQKQVKDWNADGRRRPMCTARAGWKTISLRIGTYKETMSNINVDLYDVLEVDQKARTVRVEPLATMGQITSLILPTGWTLALTPELDDLTVGGLIAGFGVETSSHKHGLFQHIVKSIELVTADGEVVNCSATENPELFYSIPWSYGTLGFIVSAQLKLVPTKKYAHITYTPCHTQQDYTKIFEAAARNMDNDFVECLVYSQNEAVVMTGVMTDHVVQAKRNAIGNYYKPWFYKHVEQFLTIGPSNEYIPLRDYYHRHSRSIFWELSDIIPFGNEPIFRYLFGWAVPPKVSLLKLTQIEATRKLYELHHVVQDMLVPISSTAECVNIFHDEFDLYPLWLCPMQLPSASHAKYGGFLKPAIVDGKPEEMFVDIGAYGNPANKGFVAAESMKRVEAHVRRLQGFQALYADCYMTEQEFEQMFDHTTYKKLRKQYRCEDAFPTVYGKINRSARK
ncbi:hypothetical protein SARC_00596 [Sphaeroforma arctica JP610]|uniref:Delta(24)-sterol reductase n=1 Tax=Sphaeroforma arctica JP610 TaxID=667725 RepID=A0A0L0GG56_9EUKA|nr:hypothetical protein SARC_00596 [Sphaeroforma arctica JP610]KNC87268.1 hypothetical protein SARC_00596 [Sphaeroforma arctica JP610]|eukprot:XP_014161170.1 hypothetical protein SARC_00596 [Sphaeroforma arctica JP610]